jgi:photosystem II stability/assembly factor-like uncharacterized protein
MKNKLTSIIPILFAFVASILFIVIPQGRFSGFNEEESEETGESGPLKAFEWWYAQRALPGEMIPTEGYRSAAQYLSRSMTKERRRSVSGTTATAWESIGPVNIGGRVLALAIDPVDPNIVWAGSASGGLWKSTTGGTGLNAWSYINTGLNVLSVSAITFDPSDHNIIYIGTGEISMYKRPLVGTPGARASYGLGILKSTDGGDSWAQTGLTWTFPEITAIQKIIVNPLNPKTIYAATSEGVFRSKNAGTSWNIISTVLMAMDIVMSPADTSLLISSHGNLNSTSTAGMYRTTDAGATWTLVTSGLPTLNFGRTSLSISPSDPTIVYAGIANGSSSSIIGLYRSTDSGVTWSIVSSTNYVGSQGWYDNIIAVHPNNPDTVFCAGYDIYKSANGGTTLSDISSGVVHVDHHAIAFDPTNPSIVYYGTDGGIYKTTNGGQSFINCNNGFVTTQFYPGFANARGDSTIALGGLQDNGTLKYSGSGYWDQVFGADGGWCAIDPTNPDIMYFEYQYLQIMRSTDGGWSSSFIIAGLPTGPSNTNFIPPFVIAPSSPSTLYAGSKNVYKSTNAGTSWFASDGQTTLNGTNIACIGVAYTSAETVITATGTGTLGSGVNFEVYASTNGGQLWAEVTNHLNGSDSLPFRYPTDIEFDPTNNATAYLTYSGYNTSHVFKTTNVGATWTDISGNLPNIPHQAVCVDPLDPASIYVGTDLGVFYSSNNGGSWEEFNTGMPPAMVLDLAISYANGKIRAATFGNGVYERPLVREPFVTVTSPNGGESLAGGYPATITWSKKFIDSVDIYYSTDNGATWQEIAQKIPAEAQSFSWMVPLVASTEARIKIIDAVHPEIADSSDGVFSMILDVDAVAGWNLISLHLNVGNPQASALFPNASSGAFTYESSYILCNTLLVGNGYWVKFPGAQFFNYTGDSITIDTINVRAGWNLIGSISHPVNVSDIVAVPENLTASEYFGYKNGYFSTDTIEPKSGYWIKAKTDGQLILSSPPPLMTKQTASPLTDISANSITITDKAGNRQTLYFSQLSEELTVERYEMPPLPPEGTFDARFVTQRMLDAYPENLESFYETAISVQSSAYPLTISCNITDQRYTYSLIDSKRNIVTFDNHKPILLERQAPRIILHIEKSQRVFPSSFSLEQNYPNPFNPSTDIRFTIQDAGFTTLKVCDILGHEVATLVNEFKQPGAYTVSWNPSNIPSGVYFYSLTSGKSSIVKKMLLLR